MSKVLLCLLTYLRNVGYKKSVGMLKTHLTGICNYFENHTTNGLTEGMNTKIKLIKRKSYGFANFEHLRLKLLACFNS
jgi:transposase